MIWREEEIDYDQFIIVGQLVVPVIV